MSDQTTEATSQMPLEADNGNPSMEDILSSIRRIIADDDAQAVISPPDGAADANLDNLAITTPEQDADASLILDVDQGLSSDAVLDLENILILDEDDYSDDALEIPDVDMLEQALTIEEATSPADDLDLSEMNLVVDLPEPTVPELDTTLLEPGELEPIELESSDTDNAGLDIEQMLESSLDDLDMVILDTPVLDEAAVDLPAFDTALVADVTTPDASSENNPITDTLLSDSLALEEDIFTTSDQDLDLILDDDTTPTSSALEAETPTESSLDFDMAAVLSVIDDNISDIEDPQADREASAIEIEALLDGDMSDNDTLDDIMATLLDDSDDALLDLDMPSDVVTEPEIELEAEPEPEIGDITLDTDIELVKSLMADLTIEDMEEDVLVDTDAQDALVTPEPTLSKDSNDDVSNPIVDLTPEPDTIDNVLDDIFELAMEDEEVSEDDQSVATVDASISSLLKIAAQAEEDAHPSLPPLALEPEPTPEVLDIMPTQVEPEEDDVPDIDALFSESLISSEDAPDLAPSTVAPERISEPESHSPTLAIEALAAQTFSIDALFDDEEEEESDELELDVTESVAAMTTPETIAVEDTLPAPTVDEAILPIPDATPEISSSAPESAAPLTLPDPQPAPRVPMNEQALVAEAVSEPEAEQPSEIEANPTIDIASTAALTPESPSPEKESPEMTKAATAKAANESILDEVTESATSGAFASLTDLVEAQNEFEASGPRIGDLVQEALRPMLKEWLDENLKNIVERAVQKEVKRISSGN